MFESSCYYPSFRCFCVSLLRFLQKVIHICRWSTSADHMYFVESCLFSQRLNQVDCLSLSARDAARILLLRDIVMQWNNCSRRQNFSWGSVLTPELPWKLRHDKTTRVGAGQLTPDMLDAPRIVLLLYIVESLAKCIIWSAPRLRCSADRQVSSYIFKEIWPKILENRLPDWPLWDRQLRLIKM